MKVTEAVVKSFAVAGKSAGILFILFVVNVIWSLLNISMIGAIPDFNNIVLSARVVILGLVSVLVNIFVQGGVLGAVKDAIMSGGKAPVSNFVKHGRKFYLRFLGLAAIIVAAIFLAIFVIGILLGIPAAMKNVVFSVIMIIVSAILSAAGIFYMFLILLSPYTLVIDDVGIFKAMGNSIGFVKSNIFRVLGLAILLVLIGLGILFILWMVMGLIGLAFKLQGTLADIIGGIVSSAVNSYITVFGSAALMTYYAAKRGEVQKKDTAVST